MRHYSFTASHRIQRSGCSLVNQSKLCRQLRCDVRYVLHRLAPISLCRRFWCLQRLLRVCDQFVLLSSPLMLVWAEREMESREENIWDVTGSGSHTASYHSQLLFRSHIRRSVNSGVTSHSKGSVVRSSRRGFIPLPSGGRQSIT